MGTDEADTRRTVAIMQPTYLPWLGWFDLMDQADVFVMLDDVQFERHSWQHRNRIKGSQGEIMLTVPVRRTGLATTILEAQVSDTEAVRRHLTTILQCYARAAGLAPARDELEGLYASPDTTLVNVLMPLIRWLASQLAIDTPVLRSSELGVAGRKDELVRAICDSVGATRYLATAGSADYMAAGNAFDDGRIEVSYHNYQPATYSQLHGAFIPRLSALDAVLNLGREARGAMIAGRSPG